MSRPLMKLLFLGIVALMSNACTSMLYFPSDLRYVNEKKLDPVPEEVYVTNADGQELMSWYFKANEKVKKPITIVFTHGNGQNMSTHFRSLYWLPPKGVSFIVVGYPGYGPNPGKPSPPSTIESTQLVLDWVRKHQPKDKLFVFGQSLGGNVMLSAISEYQHKNEICGVAIEGSFLSYKKVSQTFLSRNWLTWPFQWLTYLVINDSRSISNHYKKLPDIPYLVMHGDQDHIVPFEMGEKLFAKLPTKKTFWKINGGKHIDTFARFPPYRDKFLDFIAQSCLSSSNP